MSFEKLLKPKSIAIIGATAKGGMSTSLLVNLMRSGCEKTLYLVNPKGESIFGKEVYKTIADLPETPDVVFMCIPKKFIEPSLREAAAKGVTAAVVFSSGYSEVGDDEGRADEASLKALSEELGITMMGPNCAGYFNSVDNVMAFGIGSGYHTLKKGRVGVVSQSGQVATNMHECGRVQFSYAFSAGNCATISFEDYMEFLVEDADTKVIALYLEGVKEPVRFTKLLARAVELKKPVVVMKSGSSEKGQQVAASHTGSLAGADATYDAIFKRFGVIRVLDMEELIQTAGTLGILETMPKSPNIACVNFSGGETAMCSDIGEKYGIVYPDFSEETTKVLEDSLPYYASISNPLDGTATFPSDRENYAKAMAGFANDDNIGMIVLGMNVPLNIGMDKNPKIIGVFQNFANVAVSTGKPFFFLNFYTGTKDPNVVNLFTEAGVPMLYSATIGLKVVKNIADYVGFVNKAEKNLTVTQAPVPVGRTALSERASKAVLKESGIKVPADCVVTSKEELATALQGMAYPLVLKIESNEILHKSDVGGVMLNIKSEEEAVVAYYKILDNVAKNAPKASINGILVQEMLEQGQEIIVGVNSDPQFGPMLMCGLGGIFVEVFKDVSLMPIPVTKEDAKAMVDGLTSAKILKGYRGKAYDVDALCDLMVKVSDMVVNNPEIIELDINPVFLYEQGYGIADALIVKNQ